MKKSFTFLLVLTLTTGIFVQTAISQITVSGSNGANATYTSLTKADGAFAALNSITQAGQTITITITADVTDEDGATALTGAAGMWTSLTISPDGARTISGSVALPLIDLNGADNVTIDGRINQSGDANLTIKNLNTSTSSSSCTIRFINDATGNTVKYCKINGLTRAASGGIIFFSTSIAGTTGNDNNVIDHNRMTNYYDVVNTPQAVYSAGTIGKENSNNIISNNNFFQIGFSKFITLGSNTTQWTISGNSFHEYTAKSIGNTYDGDYICINITAGNDYSITGNYFGGRGPQCSGGYQYTDVHSKTYYAIKITTNTAGTTSIQGNTIKNLQWQSNTFNDFYGIYVAGSSNYNIGNLTANTIGGATGNGSVLNTNKTGDGNFYGIYNVSTGTVVCNNNCIGSISTNNAGTLCTNIYGIYSNSSGSFTGNNNIIGSVDDATSNSIQALSASTTSEQVVYGIYKSSTTGVTVIENNTISKLTNATTNSTTTIYGTVQGICTRGRNSQVTGNTLRDLTIANANGSATNSGTATRTAATGICIINSATAVNNISGNTIYNLSNSNPAFAGTLCGIYYNDGSSMIGTISNNFIHSLSVNSGTNAANINGMKLNDGAFVASNNIVSLNGNTATTLYGIYENGAALKSCSLFFNTVYLDGSLASGVTNPSYAFYSNTNVRSRDIRNNLFVNSRSTAGGSNLHCAAYFNYSDNVNLTLGYNDYFAPNEGGVLGYWNGTPQPGVPIVTGSDGNSINTNPLFTLLTGTAPANYIPSATLAGLDGLGITTDFAGTTRANPPTMGAWEQRVLLEWTGGAATSDWNTAGNWNPAQIPTASSNVTISGTPAQQPIVYQAPGSPAVCNNLTIETAASLWIDPGKALTVNGTLSSNNDYGLYLKADENGTGSLIHNSDNVPAIVEIYVTGSTDLGAGKYHFVSIPAQEINPTSNLFLDSYLYELDANQQEVTNSNYYGKWVSMGTSTTTPLNLNKGYMVYYPYDAPGYYTFIANLNNGDFSCALTGHVGTYTFNLVPNPYPSAVNWGDASIWSRSPGVAGSCYIWSAASGNYITLPTGVPNYIPVGQAFIVMVSDEASPSLTVKNAARVHSSQAFYKSTRDISNQLSIKAEANGYSDITTVAFNEGATVDFDLQTDGIKMYGTDKAPQLYTVSESEKYSINNLPLFSVQTAVPMNFETKYTGEVTFTVSGLESFPANMSIKLEDKLTSQLINLRQQPSYIFAHQAENAAGRFMLHFNGATGVEEPRTDNGNVWIFDNTVNIYTPGSIGENALVEIFNAAGKVVFSLPVTLFELTRIPVSLSGFAVIRVTTTKVLLVKKGFFK